jgi:AcrR family transcriptional regulator
MKTQTARNQENLKEKIILIAKAIIAEKGLEGFNIREIAKRAGCAVGMVYKVFRGVDDIIIHVNSQTLDDLYAVLKECGKKNETIENIVSRLAYAYIDFNKRNPHFWSALFEYHYAPDFIPPPFYDEKIETIFLTIEEALLPSMNNDKEKVYTAARALWAGVHGICTLSLCGSLSRVKIRSEKELIDAVVFNCLLSAKQV